MITITVCYEKCYLDYVGHFRIWRRRLQVRHTGPVIFCGMERRSQRSALGYPKQNEPWLADPAAHAIMNTPNDFGQVEQLSNMASYLHGLPSAVTKKES